MCVAAAAIPALSLVLTGVGTAVGVAAQLSAARATQQAATFKAEQDRALAQDALRRGAEEEQKKRRETAALAGRQMAVLSASGVDVGSGSPLQVLSDTAALGELDAQTIRANAKREAAFHEQDARFSLMEGKNAATAGFFGALSTAVTGLGNVADKWYKPVSLAAPMAGGAAAAGAKMWGRW